MWLSYRWGRVRGLRRHTHYRQRNCEHRAAAGPRSGLHVPAVFSQYGFANAQAEAGSTAGALRGVEGVEDIGQNIRRDPGTVVLKNNGDRLFILVYADAQGPAITNFSHGLL